MLATARPSCLLMLLVQWLHNLNCNTRIRFNMTLCRCDISQQRCNRLLTCEPSSKTRPNCHYWAPWKWNILPAVSRHDSSSVWRCISLFWPIDSSPTALARHVTQSPSCVRTSVYTLWLINRVTFDPDLCMWIGHNHSSHGIEDQGQRSSLGLELGSQFETRSVGPRSSVEDSF